MPRTDPQRRFVEALESIAESSSRIAGSMEHVAALEREKTSWLRSLFQRMWRGGRASAAGGARRYKGDGGLGAGTPRVPLGPNRPGGVAALPSGEGRCIDVTPRDAAREGMLRK